MAKKLIEMGITVEELFGFEYNGKYNLVEANSSDLLQKLLRKNEELDARIEALEGKKEPPAVARLG